MRLILICVAALALGCAGMTTDKCRSYAMLAEMIALQLAEDVDPASPEGYELRQRWAEVGERAVAAGCEQWAKQTPPS